MDQSETKKRYNLSSKKDQPDEENFEDVKSESDGEDSMEDMQA